MINIYYIDENKKNLYGCPHIQMDIGEEKLIAVLGMGAEISLMPVESIIEGLNSTATTSSQQSSDKCFWKKNEENKETGLD
jgi:hypothetical protein